MQKKNARAGRTGAKSFEQVLRSKQHPDILLMKRNYDDALQAGGIVLRSTVSQAMEGESEFIVSTKSGSVFARGEKEAKSFWTTTSSAHGASASSFELILVHYEECPTLIVCASPSCAGGLLNCLTASTSPFIIAVAELSRRGQNRNHKLNLDRMKAAREMILYWKDTAGNVYSRALGELKALVQKPIRINDIAGFRCATDYLNLVNGQYLDSLRPALPPKLHKKLGSKKKQATIGSAVAIVAEDFT